MIGVRMGMVNIPIERTLRLSTGLVLFAYAATHFLSHATGIFLLDALETYGRGVLLAPWRTLAGRLLLLACVLVHAGLGLRALYRRRHLRMPASEAWQLGLGLLIPLALLPHVTDVRIGYSLYGFDDSYLRILYLFWLVDPRHALPRQFILLLLVWIHGSIGIHMWLRFRPWYARARPYLAAAALAIPAAAVLGIVNAGWNEIMRARLEPGFDALHRPPPPGTAAGDDLARLDPIWKGLALAYLAIVATVLVYRLVRDRRGNAPIPLTYAGVRTVRVPPGFSILEASRWHRIEHAAVCGGRARCSTCRVRVLEGLAAFDEPGAAERETLTRIKAPPDVRLACQVRPRHAAKIVPLVPVREAMPGFSVDLRLGRERNVTALAIDLRGSTRLAAEHLPYDALFIVDQFIRVASAAILRHRGEITSVAGDGIMSVFGFDGAADAGARDALRAAQALLAEMERLNLDLANQMAAPLRFGIGIHTGVAVVGSFGSRSQSGIHFLGDVGNIAARLEAATKELGCTMVVSASTAEAAGQDTTGWLAMALPIRGRDAANLPVFLVSDDALTTHT